MFDPLVYLLLAPVVVIVGMVQFLRWMSTKQRKRRILLVCTSLGLVGLSLAALEFVQTKVPDDLHQTYGTMKFAEYRYYKLQGRTPTYFNERVEIRLEGHETVFVYRGPRETMDFILRIQAVPLTVMHRAASRDVWGIDLNGVLVDSPQQRIERGRKSAVFSALVGLGFLVIAAMIARYVRVSKESPQASTSDDDERQAWRKAAPRGHTVGSCELHRPCPRRRKTARAPVTRPNMQTTVRHEASATLEPWTAQWLFVQTLAVPASIVFGVVVTRWFRATQWPHGNASFGGFIFILLGMLFCLIVIAATHAALLQAAARMQILARSCLLIGALSAACFGFLAQDQAESDKRQADAEAARIALAREEAALRREQEIRLAPIVRPEATTPASLQRLSQEVAQVVQHAPAGEVPPMLEASREGTGSLNVVNRASHFVDLRIAAVHHTSGTWERCFWYAPITSSKFSPSDVSVRLNSGESRLFSLDDSCREQFAGDVLEFVVRGETGAVLFKSHSAFFP